MKTYSVTLCLSIEAETEEEAKKEFRQRCIEDGFDGLSMDVEEETEACDSCEYYNPTDETCNAPMDCINH